MTRRRQPAQTAADRKYIYKTEISRKVRGKLNLLAAFDQVAEEVVRKSDGHPPTIDLISREIWGAGLLENQRSIEQVEARIGFIRNLAPERPHGAEDPR